MRCYSWDGHSGINNLIAGEIILNTIFFVIAQNFCSISLWNLHMTSIDTFIFGCIHGNIFQINISTQLKSRITFRLVVNPLSQDYFEDDPRFWVGQNVNFKNIRWIQSAIIIYLATVDGGIGRLKGRTRLMFWVCHYVKSVTDFARNFTAQSLFFLCYYLHNCGVKQIVFIHIHSMSGFRLENVMLLSWISFIAYLTSHLCYHHILDVKIK